MKYRIRDCQFNYRYFSDGAIYNSKEEVADQLIGYHSIDFSGVDGNDNKIEFEIEEYLKYHGITTPEARLKWVLEYGMWELEEVPDDNIRKEKIIYGKDFIQFNSQYDNEEIAYWDINEWIENPQVAFCIFRAIELAKENKLEEFLDLKEK